MNRELTLIFKKKVKKLFPVQVLPTAGGLLYECPRVGKKDDENNLRHRQNQTAKSKQELLTFSSWIF